MAAPRLKDRICSVTIGASIGGVRKGLKVDGHRVAFRVEKTLKSEPNKCEVEIYNLSRAQRGQIEELQPKKGDTRGIPLLIEAGYLATGAAQIWLGDLRTVWSEHTGPDWVTKAETGDGEAAKKSGIKVSYGPGTSPDVALRAIVKALGVDQGNVAAAAIKLRQSGAATLFPKRAVFSGSASVTLDNFCKSAGLEWSVQDGAVQILNRGQALSGQAFKLSSSTGLIESPSVDPLGVMTCKMLIQPGIKCGSIIVLDSETVKGNYKIVKASWEGDTHAQPWYITVEGKRY